MNIYIKKSMKGLVKAAFVAFFLFGTSTAFAINGNFQGGNHGGSAADPWLVQDCADLQAIGDSDAFNSNTWNGPVTDGNHWAGDYYKLANDINCSATSGWNNGDGFEPIGNNTSYLMSRFHGELDGNGKTVTGLYINRTTGNIKVGLFAYLARGAVIKNMGLEMVDITGPAQAGGFAAYSMGTISNSFVTGAIKGVYGTGGLVGVLEMGNGYGGIYATGIIEDAYFYGTVESSQVGGIVGQSAGEINRVYSVATLVGNASCSYIGGISGYTRNRVKIDYVTQTATITNSYSASNISCDQTNKADWVSANCFGFGQCSISNTFYDNVSYSCTNSDGVCDGARSGSSTSLSSDGGIGISSSSWMTSSGLGWAFGSGGWKYVANENGGYPALNWQDSYHTFNVAPSTPTILSPDNNFRTTDTTPQLCATVTDPDSGDTVHAKITINGQETDGGSVITTGVSCIDAATLTAGISYEWSARACDDDGACSDSTAVRNIIINTAAGTPTLDSPADNTISTDTTPELCATVSDADNDQVYAEFTVDGVGTFSGSTVDSDLQSCYTIGTGLEGELSAGTAYTWSAQGCDEYDACGGSTSDFSYEVNAVPDSYTIDSPTDGTVSTDTTPTFCATITDAESDQVYAKFTINGLDTFDGALVDSGNPSCYTVPAETPLAAGSYTWSAQVCDEHNACDTATTDFTYEVNTVPAAVTLISPEDLAFTGSLTPIFCATVTDPDNDQVYAEFDITSVGTFHGEQVATNTQSCYTIGTGAEGTLAVGTQYTWTVRACDEHGDCGPSATARTLNTNAAPTSVTLTSLASGTIDTNTTPELCAIVVDTDFEEEVRAVFTIGGIEYDGNPVTSGSESCYTVGTDGEGALAAGEHSWTAKACDDDGLCTDTATPFTYEVNSVPNQPILTTPTNNSFTGSLNPILCATVSDTDGDQVFARFTINSETFDAPPVNSNDESCAPVPGTATLANGDTYPWTAKACDEHGECGLDSSSFTLYTNTIPDVPTLDSPADATIDTDATPTFCASVSDSDTGDTVKAVFVITGGGYDGEYDGGDVVDSGTSCYTPPSDLDAGDYTWTAKACDDDGDCSAQALETRTYTVNTAPDTPSLTTPLVDTYTGSLNPVLCATVTDDDGDQVEAVFTINEKSYIGEQVASSEVSCATVTDVLTNGTSYDWSAHACDEHGECGTESATRNLNINSIPEIPTLVSPVNGDVDVDPTPELCATVEDVDPGELIHAVFTINGTPYEGEPVSDGQQSCAIVTDPLPSGFSYTWTAVACDDDGACSEAATPEYSYGSNTAASVPTLLTPENNAYTGSLTPVLCATVADADGDDVHAEFTINLKTYIGDPVTGNGESCATVTDLLTNGQPYDWSARACDEHTDCSGQSPDLTLNINSIPGTPTLKSPLDATVSNETLPTFCAEVSDVDPVELVQAVFIIGAQEYEGELVASGQDSCYTVGEEGESALTPGTTYAWTAKACDDDGACSDTVATFDYIVNAAPIVDSLNSPLNESYTGSLNPVLCATVSDPDFDNVIARFTIGPYAYDGDEVASGEESCAPVTDTLSNGVQYQWSAQACDTNNLCGDSSSDFTLNINAIPGIPVLDSPADATVSTDNTPQLCATVSDTDTGDMVHAVFTFGGETYIGDPVTETGQSCADITEALASGQYTWTAQACDDDGECSADANPGRTYTVNLAPDQAVLTTPADNYVSTIGTETLCATVSDPDVGDMVHAVFTLDGYEYTGTEVETSGQSCYVMTFSLPTAIYPWTARACDDDGECGPESTAHNLDVQLPGLGGGNFQSGIHGAAGDPWLVYDCLDLQAIGDGGNGGSASALTHHLEHYYQLNNSIDCSETNPDDADFDTGGVWADGSGFNPLGTSGSPFVGSFDGNQKIISGLYINRSGEDDVALFGNANAAYIGDFGMKDFDITGANNVAAVVAQAQSPIEKVFTRGDIVGTSMVAGIAANATATISDSYSTAKVEASAGAAAGVVATTSANIEKSYSRANVSGTNAAAIVVNANGGSVLNSYAAGYVNGSTAGDWAIQTCSSCTVTNSFHDTGSTSCKNAAASCPGNHTAEVSGGTIADTDWRAGAQGAAMLASWDFATEPVWKFVERENDNYPAFDWQTTYASTVKVKDAITAVVSSSINPQSIPKIVARLEIIQELKGENFNEVIAKDDKDRSLIGNVLTVTARSVKRDQGALDAIGRAVETFIGLEPGVLVGVSYNVLRGVIVDWDLDAIY